MTTQSARQPKGVPVGGQFAATAHDEPELTLPTAVPALPELEAFGEIPAPLEGQTLETGEPAEATFEDSCRAFFRPLDEHEAVHGPYTSQPSITEAEILDLAGIGDANLGRHRGTFLERDEDSGEPVIVVHTRNGGGNRECYQENCDGQCTGCVQTDAIPALPTYLRDEDDQDDHTYANNYFRSVDPAAGLAALEAEEAKQNLNRLQYFRNAITSGKQPPWAVLSPVRSGADRDQLRHAIQKLRDQGGYRARDRRHADSVEAAVRNGVALPASGMVQVPSEYYSYGTALKYQDEYHAAATQSRAAADALAAEMSPSLPPAIAALARREMDKLNTEAVKRETKSADNQEKIAATGAAMTRWVGIIRDRADKADAETAAAEAKLKDFDWSASFPGDAADCPPRPMET